MVSNVVKHITPSATCTLDGLVADLKAAGVDIIGLNVGEPDFATPDAICDACTHAIHAGKTKYVNVPGIASLREEICNKLRHDNGVDYVPSQICVSTGAKQALNNALLAVMNPGDEVIIPMPGWVSYVEMVKLYGGVPVCVDTAGDFQLDLQAISAAITDKTAAILLNSPNNPTGAVYSEASLRQLVDLAVAHDFYIISDEVYEKLIYNGAKHVCVSALSPQAYDHTIVINGMSKAFAMTGWRVGYSAAPLDVAQGITAIQSHTSSSSNTFSQWASIHALQHCEADIARMVAEYAKRKDYVYGRLCALPGVTCHNVDGAFYLLPNISAYFGKSDGLRTIDDSFDFCNYLLEDAHVAIVPGGAFHAPNCARIAYTNSMAQLALAMDRIETALAKLQ